MIDPIDPIFKYFGIEGASVLATLAIIMIICNVIGRLIPDDAVGWQGVVRKIAKTVGLYVSNRLTAGVTVNTVAREVAKIPSSVEEVKQRVDERIEDVAEDVLELGEKDRFRPPFPGLGILIAICMIPMISGCASTAAVGGEAAIRTAYETLKRVCAYVPDPTEISEETFEAPNQ